MWVCTRMNWYMTGCNTGTDVHCSIISDLVKCDDFLDQLRDDFLDQLRDCSLLGQDFSLDYRSEDLPFINCE
jgi:hypothetical protein